MERAQSGSWTSGGSPVCTAAGRPFGPITSSLASPADGADTCWEPTVYLVICSVLSTTFLRLGNWLRERSRNLAWGDLACIPLHWGMCLLSYWPAYAQWGALGGPGGFGDLAPGALSMLHLFISFWTLLTKGPLEFRVRVPYHNSVLTPFSPFSPSVPFTPSSPTQDTCLKWLFIAWVITKGFVVPFCKQLIIFMVIDILEYIIAYVHEKEMSF